jgi:hypothetical protein
MRSMEVQVCTRMMYRCVVLSPTSVAPPAAIRVRDPRRTDDARVRESVQTVDLSLPSPVVECVFLE